jgi:hypothetical protein
MGTQQQPIHPQTQQTFQAEYDRLLERGLDLSAQIRRLTEREASLFKDSPALQRKMEVIKLANKNIGGKVPSGLRWSEPYELYSPEGESLGFTQDLEISEWFFTPQEQAHRIEVENLRREKITDGRELSRIAAEMDQVCQNSKAAQLPVKRDQIREPWLDPQVDRGSAPAKRRRKTPLTPLQKSIRKAIREGLEGIRYCKELDAEGAAPPTSWASDQLWPGKYAKAYQDPAWRKRIQDQKTKERRRMESK